MPQFAFVGQHETTPLHHRGAALQAKLMQKIKSSHPSSAQRNALTTVVDVWCEILLNVYQ